MDLKLVAQQTPGFVGADFENVLNEAALVAARRNKSVIDASDIDEAEDRVIAGPSKKDKTVSQKNEKWLLITKLVIQLLVWSYQMLVWFIK